MTKHHLEVPIVAIGALLALAGCAPWLAQRQPEPAFIPAGQDVSYTQLREATASLNPQLLSRRLIVVDPGHGGSETGTVGAAGLKEKDVNLAVALALAERLRTAGAQVVLTRGLDVGVAATGSSLADDLRARAEVANQRRADLFLSIHHNATLDPLNGRDTTETYYKMDDPGPSQDAGLAIHRHLSLNLGLPKERLAPGNYAVLRHCTGPAVLGEASYLSNPSTEAKLRTPEAARLEAEAYLLGILDYFSRGTPTIGPLEPFGPASEPTGVVARVEGGGSAIDPASIRLEVDGTRLETVFDPLTGEVRSELGELANGAHQVSLGLRNVRGNAARLATASVRVNRPVAQVRLDWPMAVTPADGPVPLVATVTDARGMPVADGTPVGFEVSQGQLLASSSLTVGARAAVLLAGGEPAATASARAGASVGLTVLPPAGKALFGLVKGIDGKPLAGVRVEWRTPSGSRTAISGPEGAWSLGGVAAEAGELRLVRAGFGLRLLNLSAPRFVESRLSPQGSGPFSGQLVVLNPEGGPEDRDPARRRAAAYNWLVTDDLRDYLEASGARVLLTRTREQTPTDVSRVEVANTRAAAVFVTVGHGSNPAVRSFHYPTSVRGKQIAESLRTAVLGWLGAAPDGGTVPDATYTLIQTSCPSVTVYPAALPAGLDAALARREAYALYLGLQGVATGASVALNVTAAGGRPVPDAMVLLDDRWVGQTDSRGRWRFVGLEPGRHVLVVSDGQHGRSLRVEDLAPGETRSVLCELPGSP